MYKVALVLSLTQMSDSPLGTPAPDDPVSSSGAYEYIPMRVHIHRHIHTHIRSIKIKTMYYKERNQYSQDSLLPDVSHCHLE